MGTTRHRPRFGGLGILVLTAALFGTPALADDGLSTGATSRYVIDAKAAGKWKTAVQMVAIPAVLIEVPLATGSLSSLGEISTQTIGHGLLWISAILSLVSGVEYINLYRRGRKVG